MLKLKNQKEPVGEVKRAGGAATEVFCRSNKGTKRGLQAPKCRGVSPAPKERVPI